jgi:hypothetical protein
MILCQKSIRECVDVVMFLPIFPFYSYFRVILPSMDPISIIDNNTENNADRKTANIDFMLPCILNHEGE